MKPAARALSMKVQAPIVLLLLGVMVALLVLASRTGQRQFEQAKHRLDEVEAANVRMDGAISLLMFELQTDFDELARLQAELRAAVGRLAQVLPESEGVAEAARRKLMLVEQFKSRQAVFRNSRAIAGQMIDALWSSRVDQLPDDAERALFDTERALLDFLARRDPAAAESLEEVVRRVADEESALARTEEWAVLVAHAETLIDYADRLAQLFQSPIFYELPGALFLQSQQLADELARTSAAAARYRGLLFAVALVLLAFCAMLANRMRRYTRLVEAANEELEERVRTRTEELAGANEALRAEIVERENIESQLLIARKLEAIGQLAAGVGHEINTPTQYVSDNVGFLSAIWGDLAPVLDDYERTALEGNVDVPRSRKIWETADVPFLREEVPIALRQAAGGLEQIGGIVAAIKNFSHPGAGATQPADINLAIESTVTVARTQWKHVAEVVLDLDPDLPLVPCNVSAFNQVVLNLLVNAAQAIEERGARDGFGRIRISTSREQDCAVVAVEDDGPGVPAGIRDRIFDPFFTTKEVGKGSGQGLAISHLIVRQHGGSLTLEPSRSRRGARFVVRLPLDGDPVPAGSIEVAATA